MQLFCILHDPTHCHWLVHFFHITINVSCSLFTFCGTLYISSSLLLRDPLCYWQTCVTYYLTVSVLSSVDRNYAGGSVYFLTVSLSSSDDTNLAGGWLYFLTVLLSFSAGRHFAWGSLYPPSLSSSPLFIIALAFWDGYLYFSEWFAEKNIQFEQRQLKVWNEQHLWKIKKRYATCPKNVVNFLVTEMYEVNF